MSRLSSITLISLTLWLTVILPQAAMAEDTSCTTESCHPSMQKDKALHPQKNQCIDCHQAPDTETPHPSKEGDTYTLVDSPCLDCHEVIVDYDKLHPPVAAGACQACHQYHSNTQLLLIARQNQLCEKCHPPVTTENNTVVHGPVKEGKCELCHSVHGSSYQSLLRSEYSKDFFNDFDEKHYALCFRCHKIDLLLHPKTSYNTNFRDGKNNLHYIHVNRESMGRSCKLCHANHAGHLPKLMADSVQFGDWPMPINFQKSAIGGSCAPGCHAPASYLHSAASNSGIMMIPPPTLKQEINKR